MTSTYERCLEEAESATHILCDCEAIAYLRFRHLGQFLMKPNDYYDAPIFIVLHFIQSVGLIKVSWRSISLVKHRENFTFTFFLICAVGLWVLRPLLAYCTGPG
jgi:hypothetical protein